MVTYRKSNGFFDTTPDNVKVRASAHLLGHCKRRRQEGRCRHRSIAGVRSWRCQHPIPAQRAPGKPTALAAAPLQAGERSATTHRRHRAQRSFPAGTPPGAPGSPHAAAPSLLLTPPAQPQDFATLQAMMEEIQQNIALRQDTISLLTGEVSRLTSQMDVAKGGMSALSASSASLPAALSPNGRTTPPPPPPPPSAGGAASSMASAAAAAAAAFPQPSFAAPLPSLFSDDAKKNAALYGLSVAAVVFGAGVVAPVLEDKMGLGGERGRRAAGGGRRLGGLPAGGGCPLCLQLAAPARPHARVRRACLSRTSHHPCTPRTHPLLAGPAYYDFIASRGLPVQMAEVDPIIASHAGGVVGIMTAQLMNGGQQRRR